MKEKLCENPLCLHLTLLLDQVTKRMAIENKCSQPEAVRRLMMAGLHPREIKYIYAGSAIQGEALGTVGIHTEKLIAKFTKALRDAS